MARIDLSSFDKQIAALNDFAEQLPDLALDEFVRNTPIDKGRARRSTRLRNTTIIADYPYSERLDSGYSKQAPNGMVEPTVQWIQDEVDRRLKGI